MGWTVRKKLHNRMVDEGEVLALTLSKNGHTYVWFYYDCENTEVLRSIGRMASDPGVNLTWYDAAFLSKTMRDGGAGER